MSGVVSAMVSWRAGHGSARALAQSVMFLPPAKSSARDVVCRVTSNGPGLNLSPSTAVPGLVGLYQQTAGPLGPLKTPVFLGVSGVAQVIRQVLSSIPPVAFQWLSSGFRVSGFRF